MSFEIFERGLPQLLIGIMKLTELPVGNKKEINKISKIPLEKIFGLLEDYLKTLPLPDVNEFTVENRITLVNIRNIFLGICTALDANLITLFYFCEKIIKKKEDYLKLRELDINFKVKGTKKPRERKVKKVPITLKEDVHIIEATNLFNGFSYSIGPNVAENGLADELSQSIKGAQHAESDLPEKLPESNLQAEDGWPVLEDFINPILEDLRIRRETIGGRQTQGDYSLLPIERTPRDISGDTRLPPIERRPSPPLIGRPLMLDVDVAETVNLPRPPRRVRSKYKFHEVPHFSSEEYYKFLKRKSDNIYRVYYNPVLLEEHIYKKYESVEKVHSDHLFDFDFGIPATNIPALSIETPLKFRFRPPTPPATESDPAGLPKICILDLEQSEETEEPDQLRSGRSFRPSIRPSVPRQVQDALHLPGDEDALAIPLIQPSFTLPWDAPPDPVLQAQEPSGTVSSPQAPLPPEVPRDLPFLPERVQSPLALMSENDVQGKLNLFCTPENGFIVTFVEICPLSETRLTAANIFQHLIRLWSKKITHMHQTGTNPMEIFIQLNPHFSE